MFKLSGILKQDKINEVIKKNNSIVKSILLILSQLIIPAQWQLILIVTIKILKKIDN